MTDGKEIVRAFFIGCVGSSDVALAALFQDPVIEIVGVLTRSASTINSDYTDISVQAAAHGTPVYFAEQIDRAALVHLLYELQPDVVFAVGWSRLLDVEVLEIPRFGVIGYHPAALPANRGRHPLIWALALGLEETASTFFLMDEGADSGPILSQVPLRIARSDDAGDLYAKALAVIRSQLRTISSQLQAGALDLQPQDDSAASYWRKRSHLDGLIDWRMPAIGVYNLVRALTSPYPGAEFTVRGQTVILWRCEVVVDDVPANAEPGKILIIDAHGRAIVKTGIGAIRLLETSGLPDGLKEGEYL